jgi:predicted nuclease of predicted toxin-antitoxin system
MKFLCDVHIPYRLVNELRERGIEATHVNRLPQQWHTTDNEICRYADTNDYIVVSKDIDFRNSYFLRHSPRKLIRIVLGNISNDELITLFVQHLTLFQQYFQQDGYLELDKSSVNIFRESS